ncbi:hypothetical protein CDAR_580691 [Caerostris darwini]|uniref:Uncharacterized protein n=1 Tax=Caerostris darwini TaxID=1538125 RepID=A0AAV4TRY3_9ARAC|nr:hypothetical protein CDAR_580691 [Caerostris darwini]
MEEELYRPNMSLLKMNVLWNLICHCWCGKVRGEKNSATGHSRHMSVMDSAILPADKKASDGWHVPLNSPFIVLSPLPRVMNRFLSRFDMFYKWPVQAIDYFRLEHCLSPEDDLV